MQYVSKNDVSGYDPVDHSEEEQKSRDRITYLQNLKNVGRLMQSSKDLTHSPYNNSPISQNNPLHFQEETRKQFQSIDVMEGGG